MCVELSPESGGGGGGGPEGQQGGEARQIAPPWQGDQACPKERSSIVRFSTSRRTTRTMQPQCKFEAARTSWVADGPPGVFQHHPDVFIFTVWVCHGVWYGMVRYGTVRPVGVRWSCSVPFRNSSGIPFRSVPFRPGGPVFRNLSNLGC